MTVRMRLAKLGSARLTCQSERLIRFSTKRWGEQQAALVPQRAQTAIELEDSVLADVPLKNLAVVSNGLDDPDGPLVVESEIGAG